MENNNQAELLIVMPVYNEEASVRKVVLEWFTEIEQWTEKFTFLIIDDGSKDSTPSRLEGLAQRLGPRIEIIRQANQGHGQSCLNGYRLAVERNIPFVFQIDSDGQCDPQYFFRFWPYRLMRVSVLPHALVRIPKDFFLANVALAVLLRRRSDVRHANVPIHFRERYGGEPSVRLGKFGEKALELIRQTRRLSLPPAKTGQEGGRIAPVASGGGQRTGAAEANSSQKIIETT